MMNKYKCCICGRKVLGYGNNPYPIVDDETSRCCDMCNELYVIPTRIEYVYRNIANHKGEKKK